MTITSIRISYRRADRGFTLTRSAPTLIKCRNVAGGFGQRRWLFTKIISRLRNKLRVGTFNKPTGARYAG